MGVAAFILLVVAVVVAARQIRRRSTDPRVRSLAQALMASVATAAVSTALYDAFSFPMAVTLFFVMVGACGALAMLERPATRDTSHESVSLAETEN